MRTVATRSTSAFIRPRLVIDFNYVDWKRDNAYDAPRRRVRKPIPLVGRPAASG